MEFLSKALEAQKKKISKYVFEGDGILEQETSFWTIWK